MSDRHASADVCWRGELAAPVRRSAAPDEVRAAARTGKSRRCSNMVSRMKFC